jgi:hypothetical protein
MAELTFMPHVPQSHLEERHEQRRLGVGYIELRQAKLIGGFAMAADALGIVTQMLLVERLKYIILDGEAMRYRKARIRHYRFEPRIELEDYWDG